MGLAARRGCAAALALMVLSAVSKAEEPWPLWHAYTQRFVDAQGRVIDHSAHERTTSEGQSYAMFFALVDNDRTTFEKLLGWTTANLAHGDLTLRLPAWAWGQAENGEWRTLDENSAADADLWMAYTLLEAGRLWHEPRYARLGRLLAARIARDEVVEVRGFGMALLPGPKGFQVGEDSFVLNPSYAPLPLLTAMQKELPQGPWGGVLASLPTLLKHGTGNGFAMDWVLAGPAAGSAGVRAIAAPAAANAETQEREAAGSYDAIRVYLWLGIADEGTPERKVLMEQMCGMSERLRGTVTPPLEVDPSGRVLKGEAPIGFSAAVLPYLEGLGMKDAAQNQEDRLAVAREPESGLYGRLGEYYDQNLVLFSTGWSEKRYRFDREGKLRLKWKQVRGY